MLGIEHSLSTYDTHSVEEPLSKQTSLILPDFLAHGEFTSVGVAQWRQSLGQVSLSRIREMTLALRTLLSSCQRPE